MDMPDNENMMEDKAEDGMEEGTSIELLIAADGKMTVSVENENEGIGKEDEGDEQETEVANLEEALMLIKQLAEGVTNDSKMGYEEQENTAYEKEMSGDMT